MDNFLDDANEICDKFKALYTRAKESSEKDAVIVWNFLEEKIVTIRQEIDFKE